MEQIIDVSVDTIRRRLRIISILDVCENAGLVPVQILKFHVLAYLSNVLAPVWEMPVLDGKILKRRGGPFYPVLQHDLDQLVAMGVVVISNLSHILDDEKRWRLEGSYRLNHSYSRSILEYSFRFKEERVLYLFLQELAYAFSSLSDDDIVNATNEDATYSDPMIDIDSVVDFADWHTVNFSANAARHFSGLLPGGSQATPGEMLHMYVRHLYRRLHSDR
jgi:hypothetical protein